MNHLINIVIALIYGSVCIAFLEMDGFQAVVMGWLILIYSEIRDIKQDTNKKV